MNTNDRRGFLLAAGAACMITNVAAQAAEPGVSSSEVLLGQSAMLSGPLGEAALTVQAGARLVFDDINAQGGVAERQLRLIALDDGLQADRAQANYQALLHQHKVFACVCGTGAAPTLAAAPLLRESGAPLIGASAVTDSVRDKTQGVAYYTRASWLREAEALVQHLTTLGMTRLAVAHLATPGGQEVKNLIEALLAKQNLLLHASAAVMPDGSGATEAGQALAIKQPQAVIQFMDGGSAAALMRAAWAKGGSPSFYGMSVLSGEVAARLLGAQARGLAISQVTPYPWDGANPDAIHYRRLAELAKVPISYHSYEGYVAGRVVVESLKRIGRELTRARLHAALRSMSMRVAGMDIDFSGNQHTGSRFVELVQVRPDGRFVR
ncbi:ABC transporter substrate-binding protein [Variovorax sp. LARHSF232]